MNKIPALVFAAAVAFTLAPVRSAFAAEPPPADAVVITHAQVETAFAHGTPMLMNSSYKIQAGRRVTAPGQVEIHSHDTDIFYITEGNATLITGGTTEGAQPAGEGEVRGEKITGGIKRTLQQGDIIVIPAGVPHWFTAVSNPFLYLVIKVTK